MLYGKSIWYFFFLCTQRMLSELLAFSHVQFGVLDPKKTLFILSIYSWLTKFLRSLSSHRCFPFSFFVFTFSIFFFFPSFGSKTRYRFTSNWHRIPKCTNLIPIIVKCAFEHSIFAPFSSISFTHLSVFYFFYFSWLAFG